MKLAINGWRIHGSTGVARYIVGVVQGWTPEVVADRFSEINLYTPRPIDRTRIDLPANIRERVLTPDWRMLVWENLRLGPKCKDDVLWCPSYSRPLRTRAKVVVTTHDATVRIHPHLYPLRARVFYSRLYGSSARRATLVLTHNETTCSDIVRYYGVARERIRVVPLAPAEIFRPIHDEGRLTEIRRRYIGTDDPFFLTVGKLSGRRNIPTLIEGFARFKKATKLPHKLVVVGQNTLGLKLSDMASELGIPGDLVHPDWVPDEDLVGLYSAAEAFALAATYEANSFTSLEAQATGTPVIIPDTPGLREMTGDLALVMPRVGAAEIADAMERMASDGALRARLATQGLEHATAFSWERTARETLAVLEEAGRMDAPRTREREPVSAS